MNSSQPRSGGPNNSLGRKPQEKGSSRKSLSSEGAPLRGPGRVIEFRSLLGETVSTAAAATCGRTVSFVRAGTGSSGDGAGLRRPQPGSGRLGRMRRTVSVVERRRARERPGRGGLSKLTAPPPRPSQPASPDLIASLWVATTKNLPQRPNVSGTRFRGAWTEVHAHREPK